METRQPPIPEYRTQQEIVAVRDYRVVFWEHQLPPQGSGIPKDQMGWAELTIDLADAQDVQEAIEWAEAHIHSSPGRDNDEPHGERLYVLYAKVPGENRYFQIAGWDPTRSPDAPPEWNLRRRPA